MIGNLLKCTVSRSTEFFVYHRVSHVSSLLEYVSCVWGRVTPDIRLVFGYPAIWPVFPGI